MKHGRIIIEGDFDEDGLIAGEDGIDFDYAMQRLVDDIHYDVQADWPGKNFKISYEIDTGPEPPKSDTPGHLIVLLEVNLTDGNDLEGRIATCTCGLEWGVDGRKATKPFRSAPLAQRVGELHLYKVKNNIPEED